MKFLLALLLSTTSLLQGDRPLGLTSLTEETKETVLKTTGEIPSWLSGTFIRNGPALFNVGDKYVSNWVDGLAMLHSFQFASGKVTYKNRFLQSSQYHTMVKEKSLDFTELKKTSEKKEANFIPNANVSIAKFADSYVALTEIPLPVIFDEKTLETKGPFRFVDILPTTKIWECAHPHIDPVSGDIYNYQVHFVPEAKYVIYSMEKGTKTRGVIAEIPVKEPAYMHSFAMTATYLIFVEFPLFITPQDFLKDENPASHYKWKDDQKMRILLINKKSGSIDGEYFAEPIFAWHHINSFEHQNSIYIDLSGYKDGSSFTSIIDLNDCNNDDLGRFVRYKIDLELKKVHEKVVGPTIEMPHINERYNGKPYTYVYGYDISSDKKRGLVKVDTNTRAFLSWSEEGCFADEPIFVQNSESQKEDDGVVMANVLDTKSKKSFLLVLDAKRFKELGRAEVPHHIPYGLHGDFLKDKG